MNTGRVKNWNSFEGWGFIIGDDGEDDSGHITPDSYCGLDHGTGVYSNERKL